MLNLLTNLWSKTNTILKPEPTFVDQLRQRIVTILQLVPGVKTIDPVCYPQLTIDEPERCIFYLVGKTIYQGVSVPFKLVVDQNKDYALLHDNVSLHFRFKLDYYEYDKGDPTMRETGYNIRAGYENRDQGQFAKGDWAYSELNENSLFYELDAKSAMAYYQVWQLGQLATVKGGDLMVPKGMLGREAINLLDYLTSADLKTINSKAEAELPYYFGNNKIKNSTPKAALAEFKQAFSAAYNCLTPKQQLEVAENQSGIYTRVFYNHLTALSDFILLNEERGHSQFDIEDIRVWDDVLNDCQQSIVCDKYGDTLISLELLASNDLVFQIKLDQPGSKYQSMAFHLQENYFALLKALFSLGAKTQDGTDTVRLAQLW